MRPSGLIVAADLQLVSQPLREIVADLHLLSSQRRIQQVALYPKRTLIENGRLCREKIIPLIHPKHLTLQKQVGGYDIRHICAQYQDDTFHHEGWIVVLREKSVGEKLKFILNNDPFSAWYGCVILQKEIQSTFHWLTPRIHIESFMTAYKMSKCCNLSECYQLGHEEMLKLVNQYTMTYLIILQSFLLPCLCSFIQGYLTPKEFHILGECESHGEV
jgi:hypothetical protein